MGEYLVKQGYLRNRLSRKQESITFTIGIPENKDLYFISYKTTGAKWNWVFRQFYHTIHPVSTVKMIFKPSVTSLKGRRPWIWQCDPISTPQSQAWLFKFSMAVSLFIYMYFLDQIFSWIQENSFFILRVYAVSVLYNHDLLMFAVENESQPIQELSSIPKRMLPFMTDENSMDSVASSNISGITY